MSAQTPPDFSSPRPVSRTQIEPEAVLTLPPWAERLKCVRALCRQPALWGRPDEAGGFSLGGEGF